MDSWDRYPDAEQMNESLTWSGDMANLKNYEAGFDSQRAHGIGALV